MQIQEECRLCLARLVDLTVGLATGDPVLKARARDQALAVIAREFSPTAIPALIANQFHRLIMQVTGNADPFKAHKAAETAFLAEHFAEVSSLYAPNLEALLRLAVLGNAVDFFRSRTEVVRDLAGKVTFTLSHLEAFQHILARGPGLLLYLADNAGEERFDAPLVQHLRSSGWEVLYVVKGGPIQNDLTLSDLKASELHEMLMPVVDTGARTVGLVLEETSPIFRELYAQARLIVAKGMGHFETLSHLGDPRVFFLLQAKCNPVARGVGVARGSFVFFRSPKIYP